MTNQVHLWDNLENTAWFLIHARADVKPRHLWYRHRNTQEHWWQMGPPPDKLLPSLQPQMADQQCCFYGNVLSDKTQRWERNSLFGQLRTGLEKEAVEGCVLVGEVRGRSGALEVQAAHDDVEHRGHRRQLHAVKHCWQLRRDGVHVWLVGVHDYSEK